MSAPLIFASMFYGKHLYVNLCGTVSLDIHFGTNSELKLAHQLLLKSLNAPTPHLTRKIFKSSHWQSVPQKTKKMRAILRPRKVSTFGTLAGQVSLVRSRVGVVGTLGSLKFSFLRDTSMGASATNKTL